MFLFNIVFISLAQSLLLCSITTPTYLLLLTERLATYDGPVQSWDLMDTISVGVILILIATSFMADQQQWDFHGAKEEYQKTARVPNGWHRAEMDRGFLTRGLFAYSRHPNFAAEQSVWGSLYLWSCLATKAWYNWTGFGAAAYLILFQASTWLTELLSAGKYPEYKEYQKKVGKFLPLPGYTNPVFYHDGTQHANGATAKDEDASKARQRYDLR